MLRAAATERGYRDPRWVSARDAAQLGARVRQGEPGTQLEYWRFPPKGEARSKEAPAGEEPGKPQIIHRTYTVFNAEQCEKMPEREYRRPRPDWEASERAARLLRESGATIEHRYGNRAYYQPKKDKIVLPPREQFRTYEAYYATALHELGHWTGHKERLDRDTLQQGIEGGYGSEAYAREELRAEMTSMAVNAVMKLPHDPERHASYVDGWIQALKKDPNELRQAARDAERMASCLLQHDRYRPQDIEEPSRQDDYSSPMPQRQRSVEKEPWRARDIARERRRGPERDPVDDLLSR